MTIVNYDDIYFWMEDSQSERYINYIMRIMMKMWLVRRLPGKDSSISCDNVWLDKVSWARHTGDISTVQCS